MPCWAVVQMYKSRVDYKYIACYRTVRPFHYLIFRVRHHITILNTGYARFRTALHYTDGAIALTNGERAS